MLGAPVPHSTEEDKSGPLERAGEIGGLFQTCLELLPRHHAEPWEVS